MIVVYVTTFTIKTRLITQQTPSPSTLHCMVGVCLLTGGRVRKTFEYKNENHAWVIG